MSRYRAAYWISDDRQSDLVLTSPDEATIPDDELLERARAEAERAGVDLSGGELRIGDWTDRSPECEVDDCDRPAYAKGLCVAHYHQARRAEEAGREPSFRPVRDRDAPAREVLSLRVSPSVRAAALADPDGARAAIERWAREENTDA